MNIQEFKIIDEKLVEYVPYDIQEEILKELKAIKELLATK